MLAGHSAFVMLAGMYFMTDAVLLRVLGIAANLLDMAYCFKGVQAPLWLNIRWGALYVVINVVQLYLLYSATRAVDLDPESRELYTAHFQQHGVSQPQFAKLLTSASRRSFTAGATLIAEGQPSDSLLLLTSGAVAQHKEGIHLANADSTFVGNLAFLSEEASTYKSTYSARDGGASALEWPASELKQLLARNPELGVCVRAMLHAEALKTHAASLSHAPLTAYASILAGVLSDGLVGEQERTFCAAFRAKHGVTDEQHAAALRSAGWDVAAFEAGKLAVGAK